MNTVDVVILAAGKGTRMQSKLPKVLHPLAGRPFVMYSVDAAAAVSTGKPTLVIGHQGERVRETVGEAARYVEQNEQLGTGHAVAQARDLLEGTSDYVIVIYADMPLLRSATLQGLLTIQKQNESGPFSMLTYTTDNPRGFGRIVRGEGGSVQAIVEEADATEEQKAIREVNIGIYCFESEWLWAHLDDIPLSAKGEYYLTDLVAIAVEEGHHIKAAVMDDPVEAIGINTRVHLAEAEAALRERVNRELMGAGVTLIDPATTYIHPTVSIGQDTLIYPNTIIEGYTSIGPGCTIGPNTIIRNSSLGSACRVETSVIEQATLENHVDVGPFAHLRKGAYLENDVHMGNFGEVKNSRLRRGVKMGHFGYIGDGDIGEETNIGAGTITCNYDGENKHKTVVGRKVFIGSDTMLVAPVELGDGARTGAGSVVTANVPAGTLVYGVPAKEPAKER